MTSALTVLSSQGRFAGGHFDPGRVSVLKVEVGDGARGCEELGHLAAVVDCEAEEGGGRRASKLKNSDLKWRRMACAR